ncbi:MAG TPA: hypothetical protein VN944_01245 [Nitrospiria bacterium]|nr:hypothetical protein [Nitrospiria bacterium]
MPTPTEKILLCSRESIALWRSLQRFEEIIQKCLAHAPKLPLEIKEEVASTLLSMAQLQPSNSLWYEKDLTEGNRAKANARNTRWRAKQAVAIEMPIYRLAADDENKEALILFITGGGIDSVYYKNEQQIIDAMNARVQDTKKDVEVEFMQTLVRSYWK